MLILTKSQLAAELGPAQPQLVSFLDTSSTYLCAELTLDVFFAHSAIILVSSPELMKLLKVVHVCPDF